LLGGAGLRRPLAASIWIRIPRAVYVLAGNMASEVLSRTATHSAIADLRRTAVPTFSADAIAVSRAMALPSRSPAM
jgi:hypothetical protein